ncbi:MAG: LamG-like jellyroll fold domain-containing protein [Planctomycetota bacterium]|jgi:3',5'-cyclic AMP phosphodiesterase CpdA
MEGWGTRAWAAALALALLVGAAHADPDGVKTSRKGARVLPLPKGDDVFHFVIYGDRTGGKPEGLEVLKDAVRQTNLLDPDFVMTVGDLVNGYNTTAEWIPQMKAYRAIMEELKMPWYPVAGNHDVYWRGEGRPRGHHEANYEKHFGPLWYSFRHKNAAFIVLYSDEGDAKGRKGWRTAEQNRMSDKQLAWLRKTLAETKDADHVFVFLHHPRWIKGRYVEANWDDVHAALKAPGNVRVVFAGHIHRQGNHGRRDGIEYRTLATTGGRLPYEARGSGWLHHFDVVTVRKQGIRHASIPVGAVFDPGELTPERLKEVDLLRQLRPEHSDPIAVTPKLTPQGNYTLRFSNPTKRPIELTLGTEARDRAWWWTPDHAHARIEPGATQVFRFRYLRIPRGEFRVPRFELNIDYLGETQRITMPTRWILADVRLDGITEEWWKGAGNQALRIEDDRSALGVSSQALALPDGPFTVEARVRLERIPKRAGVVAKTERSEFGMFVNDGIPSFDVHLDGKYARVRGKASKLRVNTWHDLAGVYDGSELRLYVDGRLVARRNASGKRTPNALPLFIGADPDRNGRPNAAFPGWIDEVRISKTARYTGEEYEPRARAVPDADTVLLLHLDRPVGPLHPDHSPRLGHAWPVGRVRLQPVE